MNALAPREPTFLSHADPLLFLRLAMLRSPSPIRFSFAPCALAFTASVAVAFGLAGGTLQLHAEPFTYQSENESATLTVSPSVKANAEGDRTAALFTDVLRKITGSTPSRSESLERGIVFATAEEFPEIAKEAQLDPTNPFHREDYLLRSSKDRLLVIGATPIAIRRAMADLLHRWGYRQFFPSTAWEIVPSLKELTLDADAVERPAYVMRDLFTTSFLPGEEERYNRWQELNRMGRGFLLNTRHSYQAIYKRHKATFDATPEYFCTVDGTRLIAGRDPKFKFNAANDDLLALLVKDAQEEFKAPDAVDSISMDPSDFGGWDTSGATFKKLGKPSNQAVTMANIVANEVASPLGKYVGMYAYADHQFPPDIRVASNIIVSFATRFLKPGQDLYKNIEAWRQKGVEQVGIREYSSVWEWDFSMPGRALGGNLAYLEKTIPRYKKLGALFYTSEMQSSWGAYGLGYYVTAQLLWNPEQEAQAIVDDFLQKSFGPAAEPMRTFYSRLNGADSVLARYSSPARLYAPLVEAFAAAKGDAKVEQRLIELLAYVRYTELFATLERTHHSKKQAALEEVYDFLFRAAPFQMLPTRAIALHPRAGLRRSFSTLVHQSQAAYQTAIEEATARPLTKAELLGHAEAALTGGGNIAFTNAPLPTPSKVNNSPWVRNSASFTFILNAGEELEVKTLLRRFGFSEFPRYVVMGPADETASAEGNTIIQRGAMSKEEETILLKAKAKGNYTLVFECTPNIIKCSAPKPYYINPTADSATIDLVSYRGSLYFTVPTGEKAQIAVGGQGRDEKVFASIATGKKVITEGRDVNGLAPIEEEITAKEAPEEIHISLRAPTEGFFEDHFLQFQGDFTAPVSLSPSH